MASPVPVSQVLPLGLLSKSSSNGENDKLWDGKISVTASTEDFWGLDKGFQLKSLINKLKRKFHEHRYLKVKFLPTNVTEQKIQQMLSDFPVAKIQCHRKADSAGMANVFLEDPELYEEWDRNRVFMLRGQRIPVHPTLTENWVCVARLPLTFTKREFHELVKSAGEVRNFIYMISEKTGDGKGYGVVDYQTKDKAQAAVKKLQSVKINDLTGFGHLNNNVFGLDHSPDLTLWVEFLHSKCITFESLHSKCLLISNLPPAYKDMATFRKMFSVVAPPPYCQIAMKNGVPLPWGLVEFNTGEEAEMTFNKMNGELLGDRPMRIAYCVPGVRAIHLYTKLLAKEVERIPTTGTGLLPDPPAPDVFQAVRKLRQQNPIFAMNLEHILASEMLGGKVPPSTENSSESDKLSIQSKRARRSEGSCSRTPSPLSDTSVTPTVPGTCSTSLPPVEESPAEGFLTKKATFPVPGNSFVNQSSLHHMLAAAQTYGNDPSQVVPEVMPYRAAYPFGSHIPVLPVGYIPLGAVPFSVPVPVVPQAFQLPLDATAAANTAVSALSTPESIKSFHSDITALSTPPTPSGMDKITPPRKSLSSSPQSSGDKLSPSGKIIEDGLNSLGVCYLWSPKEVGSPKYKRLAPNGLVENIASVKGGIWPSNISSPSSIHSASVWPINTDYDFSSVANPKRARN